MSSTHKEKLLASYLADIAGRRIAIFQTIRREDSEFTVSEGVLDRFKKSFGNRQITISGETLSANKEAVPLFKDLCPKTRVQVPLFYLVKFIKQEEIPREQLYNYDETGLNYKKLPTKTLVSKERCCCCGIQEKQRMSHHIGLQ